MVRKMTETEKKERREKMRARRAEVARIYGAKDTEFAANKARGVWPCETCDKCKRLGGCCLSYGHHVGDCCTHCGNDER